MKNKKQGRNKKKQEDNEIKNEKRTNFEREKKCKNQKLKRREREKKEKEKRYCDDKANTRTRYEVDHP